MSDPYLFLAFSATFRVFNCYLKADFAGALFSIFSMSPSLFNLPFFISVVTCDVYRACWLVSR